MRRAWIWLLAAAMIAPVLAGCVGDTDETGTSETPGEAAALPTGEPTPAELDARSLDAPPQLRLGEWWDVRVTNELDDGAVYERRIVVVGQDNGSYLLGTPAEASMHELLILHLPGLGVIDPDTFGYEAHDVVFEPVRFPLEPGKTWETEWYTGPLDAEVVESGTDSARVQLVGQNTRMNITYEPQLAIPSTVEVDGYGAYEVTDHGFGHEGPVEAPKGRDLVILNGRVGPVLDTTLSPGPPVESVEVEDGYDRVTFALVLGNLLVQDTSGAYRAAATTPAGETYEQTFTPTPEDQVQITPYSSQEPGGTWQLEYEAGGPGVAAVEAVAYDLVEATLPPAS